MTKGLRLLLLSLACGPLAGACTLVGDDLYDPFDAEAPRVVETYPAQDWIQVPTGIDLRIWFTEAVDPESVDLASISLYSGDHLARCRYRVDETGDGLGLVVMSPLEPLVGGVRYELWINRAVRDRFGNALAEELRVSFSTLR